MLTCHPAVNSLDVNPPWFILKFLRAGFFRTCFLTEKKRTKLKQSVHVRIKYLDFLATGFDILMGEDREGGEDVDNILIQHPRLIFKLFTGIYFCKLKQVSVLSTGKKLIITTAVCMHRQLTTVNTLFQSTIPMTSDDISWPFPTVSLSFSFCSLLTLKL